jgi:hypothetical protein
MGFDANDDANDVQEDEDDADADTADDSFIRVL